MIKLVFKKILYDYLSFFLLTIISVSTIVWIFQAVNFLDLIAEDGKSYMTYVNYSLLNLPKIISKILPFTLFFSYFYILNKYEASNELLIFWKHGINKIQFVHFFFYVSLILMCFQLLLSVFIVPNTLKYSRNLMNDESINLFEGLLKPGKFNDNIKELTIHVDEKNKNGDLINVFIKKNTGKNSFQITYAKKGKLKVGLNNSLELYDGETINNINNKISKFSFAKSDFNLNDSESNSITYIKLQETPSQIIFACLNKLFDTEIKFLQNIEIKDYPLNCKTSSLENIFEEIYRRLILPLYIPFLFLITSLLVLKSKEEKYFNSYKVFIFLFNFILILLTESSVKLISNELIKNLYLIISPIIMALIFIIFFNYIFKIKLKLIKLTR
jgi:lipopolysaccharide export system permease protein